MFHTAGLTTGTAFLSLETLYYASIGLQTAFPQLIDVVHHLKVILFTKEHNGYMVSFVILFCLLLGSIWSAEIQIVGYKA